MAQSDLRQGIENANLASTIEEQEESSFDTFIANLTDKENATIAAEERIARAKTLIDKGFWDEQQKQLNALNKNDADYAQKVAEIKRILRRRSYEIKSAVGAGGRDALALGCGRLFVF